MRPKQAAYFTEQAKNDAHAIKHAGLGHAPSLLTVAPRPSISAQCQLDVIADSKQFDALEGEWNALFERAGRPCHIFQSHSWLWHWANFYLDSRRELSIVAGRRGGRLVLIWPLVLTRTCTIKRLAWMGEPIIQYGDALVDNGEDALLNESWSFITGLGADLIELRKTRNDAAVYGLLARLAVPISYSTAPFVDLTRSGNGDAFQQRYSAKTRSNWRRHRRRLQELGPVAFEQHCSGVAAHDLVVNALALKRAWLDQRGFVSPVLQDERLDRFLQAIALAAVGRPSMRISAMRCNGKPVAVEISFACNGHVFGDIIAHAVNLEKYGAGVLLAEYSIRTAQEQGYARFDMMAPADAYKLGWADDAVQVTDWAVPLSAAGAWYLRLWVQCGRLWLKRLGHNLPRPLANLASRLCRWRTHTYLRHSVKPRALAQRR
jgi:CelD/BcsL family acetyltransferase involved in cellulose biosynthesis